MNTPAPPSRSMMDLRELTPARVALGRDAVHAAFDTQALIAALRDFGLEAFDVRSRAGSRGDYLRRPDLGRRLDQASLQALAGKNGGVGQLALVIGDGLSPTAVHAH